MTDMIPFEIPEDDEQVTAITLPESKFLDVGDAVLTYRRLTEFVSRVLTLNIDYGIIPGTNKPSMYKPGAEKMRRFFSLMTETIRTDKVEQWGTPITATTFPLFSYTYVTNVRDVAGGLIASCEGSCNSYEKKYRWRWTDGPPAGFNLDELVSEEGIDWKFGFAIDKAETTGKYGMPTEYWESWKADIESGVARKTRRKSAKGQEYDAYERGGRRYRIPNDDIYDQLNTIMKMAQKRSFVGAILQATGSSEFFTQDLEDYEKHFAGEEESIKTLVPHKDVVARRLIAYVGGKGIENPGEYIRDALAEQGIAFTLDMWKEILEYLEDKIAKG